MTATEPPDETALKTAAERGDFQATLALVEILDARGDFSGSAALLGGAARAGKLDAIAQLGARTALGAGMPADRRAAGALLEFAAERRHVDAGRWLARLAVLGAVDERLGARAVECLARAARAGDVASLEDLAQLADRPSEPDPALIDAYVAAAAPASWAAPPLFEWISEEPRIGRCEGVLALPVCAQVMEHAQPVLAPAGVTDRATGSFALDAARTNASAQVAFFAQPIALALAKRRIANLAGQPGCHLERTNILRYHPGEAFAPHWDYLDPDAPGFAQELAGQGQRVATCLIGLSDDYSEGETDFPELGIRARIPAGDALFFANVDAGGNPDPRTLHAGLPVAAGEKWLVSQWVRSRPNPL